MKRDTKKRENLIHIEKILSDGHQRERRRRKKREEERRDQGRGVKERLGSLKGVQRWALFCFILTGGEFQWR